MNKFFLSLLLLLSTVVIAQLQVPRNIQAAIIKKSRDERGIPGTQYFQNSSNYRIDCGINPATRKLTGFADIIYRNDSPDTLKQMVFRLYQNFYKPGSPRFTEIPEKDFTKGMIISDLTVNGFAPDLNNPKEVITDNTNMSVRLPQKNYITPHSSVKIRVTWEYTITANASLRQGRIDSLSYFNAYWYPQIAVYDDIDGWDRINYNGEAEFYNDISNFDINITVPNDYGVWATGVLQNPEDVLSSELLKRFNSAMNSTATVTIIGKDDHKTQLFARNAAKNTWKFKATTVPDVAFGISKKHLWYASSPVIDSRSGRKTFLQSVVQSDDKFEKDIQDISVKCLKYFEEVFPRVPYPYPSLTIFNGRDDIGGGMEYPMIVNDPSYDTHDMTIFVTSHEIAHNYFPFYMGINERKYGWMDEGWAVYSTFDLQPRLDSTFDLRKYYTDQFRRTMGTESDMPLLTPTYQMTGKIQQTTTYVRAGLFFAMFREMAGKDEYDKVLRGFIAAWNGKHPTPYDYFNCFETGLKVPLKNLFSLWCKETHYADLQLKSAIVHNGKLIATAEKIGKLPVPVKLIIEFEDGSKRIVLKEGFYWQNESSEITIEEQVDKVPVKVSLDTIYIPDATPENNSVVISKNP